MEKEQRVRNYSVIALIESLFLGASFVYLFTWKTPGISYVIFFLLVAAAAFVPVALIEPKKLFKKSSLWLFAMPLIILLCSIFALRADPDNLFFAFITLPVVVTVFLAAVVLKGTMSNFGIFSYIVLPLKIFIAWFGDFFGFLKKFPFRSLFPGSKSKAGRWLPRIILGFIIALPFFLFFAVLLSSADKVFGDLVVDFIDNTIGSWFKDFSSFMSLVGRIIVGGLVTVYYSVFNFSLWNGKSVVSKWMSDNQREGMNLKKNWDAIISSSFTFTLNILFVIFVVIQFVYLFGGSDNVIGDKANFTYAEYARKGFWELLTVSVLTYFILLVLTFKVKVEGVVQKAFYYANYIVLAACVLVITYSSHTRLSLYEEVYGFTTLRLFVHFVTWCIGLQYLFLLVSPMFKNAQRFVSVTSSILLFITYCVLVIVPGDYIVARLNLERYEDEGKIDLTYMLTLSDEAVPVIVDLADKSSDQMKSVIMYELQERYEFMKKDRKYWQSYNFWREYNIEILEDELGDEDWCEGLQNEVENFIEDYANVVMEGDFDKAIEEYWTMNAVETDVTKFADDYDLQVTSYDIHYYTFPDCDSWSLNYRNEYATVGMDVEYTFVSGGAYGKVTKSDTLELYFQDGKWKIARSSNMPIACDESEFNFDVCDVSNFYNIVDFDNYDYEYDWDWEVE
ncbi:DUF4173 domain-containing protein [Candidatus Dojkabacteria bacterium]|nr:DUF4173 domain-containing protein [Candidatus Dojkabacteria bacterium]